MDPKGEDTRFMEHLLATAATNEDSEFRLRYIMRMAADKAPMDCLLEVGRVLLRSNLDERRRNAERN